MSSALADDHFDGFLLLTRSTEPDGDYVWMKPVGGRSKARSIGTVRTDVAGLAGGMIRKDLDGEAGLSIAALTARGDASTIDDYTAKGIWISAHRRAENILDTPLFAKGSVRLGYVNSDEDRIVRYAGMTDKTEADVDRWSLGLSAHTGLAFDLDNTLRIEPYAGFQGFVHYVPSYEEDSDGVAAMHAGSALYRSLEAQVGVKLEGAVFEPNRAFWQVHAAYARELMPDAGDMKLSFAASDLHGSFKRTVDFDSKNRLGAALNWVFKIKQVLHLTPVGIMNAKARLLPVSRATSKHNGLSKCLNT